MFPGLIHSSSIQRTIRYHSSCLVYRLIIYVCAVFIGSLCGNPFLFCLVLVRSALHLIPYFYFFSFSLLSYSFKGRGGGEVMA